METLSSESPGSIKLYSYYRSSCSYRVRILLNLKNLPYETIAVHLIRDGGEQHKGPYQAINPMGQVPTLIHGKERFSQSMAICQYLEKICPDPQVLPEGPAELANCLEIAEIIGSGIQPLQNLSVLQNLKKNFSLNEEDKIQWIQQVIHKGFKSIENLLARTMGHGPYCMGEAVTLGDAFLIPQVFNANRFKLDMSEYPKIVAIHDACMQLKAFQDAAPENQPDFE